VDRRAIRCPGRPRPWDYLGSPRGAGITIGFWQEDIGFSAPPLPDYGPATVWATDFRGRDQAVEARFGAHRTRRVVSTRDRFSEGDACFIKLDPRKAFVFSDSGVRLRLEKMSAADRKAMA